MIARPRTRERIVGVPNFRDYGRTVDRALLAVLQSLQARHGEAFASEAGLRHMIFQDVGHMPGVMTLPQAIARLEKEGLLVQTLLRGGGILPDGSVCTHGTRLIVVPRARDRRALQRARNRRDGVTWRGSAKTAQTVTQARRTLARALAPAVADVTQHEVQQKRQDDTRRLAELAAQWEAEERAKGKGKPPPD